MQKVKLVGEIAKFGSSWETNCANIGDIFKLIDCQTPGFRQHLVEGADAGIGYTIKRGEDYLQEGAKSGGGKIIAGAILIALSFVPGLQAFSMKLSIALFTMGANLAISGIAQLMAPGPETDQKQEEGYLFQGPQNNIQQGLPVPVCYGELLVGGAPISLSFRPEYTNQYGRGRGIGIVQYGMGGYYVAYNSFLNTNIPTTAVPSENNEFEVAA